MMGEDKGVRCGQWYEMRVRNGTTGCEDVRTRGREWDKVRASNARTEKNGLHVPCSPIVLLREGGVGCLVVGRRGDTMTSKRHRWEAPRRRDERVTTRRRGDEGDGMRGRWDGEGADTGPDATRRRWGKKEETKGKMRQDDEGRKKDGAWCWGRHWALGALW